VPLISYSQNLEDVLLMRALGQVDGGTYVDVGAGDPVVDSVSKAFYDRGWSGLNIEPNPAALARLQAQRPRDVNLGVAIGEGSEAVPLYVVSGYEELSSTDPGTVERYRDEGRTVTETLVPVKSLTELLDEHATGAIHFLKLDLEGGEAVAFAGLDLERHRPWIIVAESVVFGRDTEGRPDWEAPLLAARYHHVWFDGLNEYYVADEHAELDASFGTPVNVRDDYVMGTVELDDTVLGKVAERLGLEPHADAHEIIERLDALANDRVAFELRLGEASANVDQAVDDLQALADELAAARVELEVTWQRSFERERWIAAQAAEIQRLRGDRAAADDTLRGIYQSGSWRYSLPLRVLRRPAPYVRKLLGR
jgi:FkbM family methyltransferase